MAETISGFPAYSASADPGVAHISLVFREMWDTAALNPEAFGSLSTLKV
jgi:hypothetical protein